ncbi:MAG TPA: VWA domain-containing protein [Candidatus Limnocylindria bacterium]|nr:VWA domain-containing protein [Candidatus Limnocylindria bacterium]
MTSYAAGILTLALAGMVAASTLGEANAYGQSQSQQQVPQSDQTLKVGTTVVNVFATVRDKHHAIISDLTEKDFKILEDGQQQKVAFFSREKNLPITLGILIDTSGSMDRILNAEQDAASQFLQRVMRKTDEAMVISFDLDVNLLADFTADTRVLERAIRRTVINAPAAGIGGTVGTIPTQGGGTNLYDAVYLAAHDELATEAGRKAIILLSDCEDTGSRLKIQDAIEAAQRADTVIHVLLLRDFMATSGSGPGVASKMSSETGGRVIDVHNNKTLEKAFDEIAEELSSQYVLGYYPTNEKRDGTFRKIQVEIVSRPDVKVTARKGYYAPRK